MAHLSYISIISLYLTRPFHLSPGSLGQCLCILIIKTLLYTGKNVSAAPALDHGPSGVTVGFATGPFETRNIIRGALCPPRSRVGRFADFIEEALRSSSMGLGLGHARR
jgi:hypothetical protein